MTAKSLTSDADGARLRTRREFLTRAALLGAAMLAATASPALAARPALRRVIVTLIDVDREAEIEDLLSALRGYRYRLVRIDENSPTVVLDASDKTVRMLRRLDVVASLSFDEPVVTPPKSPLAAFRVTLRGDVDFDYAVETVRDALQNVRHKILRIDPSSLTMLVEMRETDIPMIGALVVVESVVDARTGGDTVSPGPADDGITPLPEGETPRRLAGARGRTQRVIVQFNGQKRNAEIRRILGALEGTSYSVVTRFDVTPAIVLKVDERAMKRLRALPGIRVSLDSVASPQ